MAQQTYSRWRWQLPLLVALSIAALKSIFILWTPLSSLVMTPWLIDDSFIVMRVARSIALGHGFSFDGSHLTTGVSPLWTYLTAVLQLFPKTAAVKGTLLLSSFFGMVATILTFNIAERMTKSRAVAWLAFLLATLLPVTFFNAMNGMETAFFTVLILLAVRSAFGIDQVEKATPLRIGLRTGLFAGLAFLTRFDAVFLIAAIVLIQGFTFLREKKHRRTLTGELGGMVLSFGICVLLYVLWQLYQAGSLLPDNQVGRRTIAMLKHAYDPATASWSQYARIAAWHFFELESLVTLSLTSTILVLLGLAAAIPKRPTAPLAILVILYGGLFGGALVLYQWYFPDFHGLRYLNPLLHLLPIFIADLLLMIPASRIRPLFIGILLFCIVSVSWYRYADFGRSPAWAAGFHLFGRVSAEDRDAFWKSITWVQEHIPETAVIAIRDHGRYAYFTDRPVQDLAGILDPGVIREWQSGRLADYLRDRSVTYAFLPPPKPGSGTIYQEIHESMSPAPVDAPAQNMTRFLLYTLR